ncbi:response regulator [Pedobacter zeae]|uniref:DNA-binding NarL/FixJ family response regulator n=1 Tax=Pedobacter zeae TaxID=1737356 RepID=A0A7W6K9Q7_9SPHI|nr:response regulator transcription factor [Pedobacter zeae]MBB4107680.1 DNA-binding NarL/FixJ family response regulator [Pedobacter zeae]GGG97742.1 DNA-binding response regulator [Pedobacter zeae]
MNVVSVLIVDDHYLVIEGVRSLLQGEKRIEWLGHATSTESCLAFLKHHQPEVILMDINLGNESGIALCKSIKEKYPAIHILGLSTFNQQSFIKKIIENGASGYVLKNATKNELLTAIFTVSMGRSYMSSDALQLLRKQENKTIILTRREKEVLEFIAEGLTNNEIAAKIFVSVTTVDTHRKNLLSKFQARNIASLVKMAVQMELI